MAGFTLLGCHAERPAHADIVQGAPAPLTFRDLCSWPYTDGLLGMPDSVQALSGTKVTLQGMVLPIDDGQALLVDAAAPWLNVPCQEGPTMNSVVRVLLPPGIQVPPNGCLATCTGTFVVSVTTMDGDCVDVFQLHADRFEVQR